ncbi:DUF2064 domain-containing protein [Winogradskyella litorisediminis]|uniref:DUF2064 domain-containing protein n=1 Tax=Winogradskyella litorisediminis TaxID=1156618 RepID=A0ABW3N3S5_9FLAO
MNQKTAILIFANSALSEAKSKPFKGSEALFQSLNQQTFKIAKNSGLPVIHFSESEQIGQTFGQRFTYALNTVYAQGYENVITIGNDTPHLSTKHILKTVKLLEENPIVLGPSSDGGFYLMGLNKAQFKTETFLKLPWQTSALNRSINRLVKKQNLTITYLEKLVDVDEASDISLIFQVSKHINKGLKALLKQALYTINTSFFFSKDFYSYLFKTSVLNKGSPVLASF